jgi:hypothetical protein
MKNHLNCIVIGGGSLNSVQVIHAFCGVRGKTIQGSKQRLRRKVSLLEFLIKCLIFITKA